MKCDRCLGSGKVANSDGAEPWEYWENLPVKNAQAVILGIVRPMACFKCQGTGNVSDFMPLNVAEIQRAINECYAEIELSNSYNGPEMNTSGWRRKIETLRWVLTLTESTK